MRPLASTDHARGHLSILAVLTQAPDPGPSAWTAQFNVMRAVSPAPQAYYPLVIVNKSTDAIVAAGTLFIERKFLRGLGSVGHIEDIAVDKAQQGKKLGQRVIEALTGISEQSGCYKTILNCSEENVGQYRFHWFYSSEIQHKLTLPFQLSIKSADTRGKSVKWSVAFLLPQTIDSIIRQAKYAPASRAQTPRL